MKSLTLFSLFSMASALTMQAQTIHRCATHEVYENNARKYPGYEAAVNNAFDYAKNYSQKAAANKSSETWDTIYHIPVVVHVVYNTTDQNINDSLIYNQIEVLNQDYRRQNPDTGNTRSIFKPIAADAGIEFFLATTDPDGNPTTGITRTQTNTQYFFNLFNGNLGDDVKYDSLGGKDAWDTEKYLNIWTCTLEDALLPGIPFLLGYAYPPADAPNWPDSSEAPHPNLQGVVIHYGVFGRNNPMAPAGFSADKGRAATHEVGHYLGLRHIWGDGNNGILGTTPDCTVDDGISDTPNSGTNTQMEAANATGCNIVKNTCIDSIGDLPDMWENYMDYSKEECQNIFTEGQVGVMRAILATSRSELPVFEDSVSTVIPAVSANVLDFTVIPNPTAGSADIVFSGNSIFDKIAIHDLVGKTWMSFKVNGGNKIPLNLADLPKGIYTITATSAEKFAAKKIVLN